jgi:hypothetical protein
MSMLLLFVNRTVVNITIVCCQLLEVVNLYILAEYLLYDEYLHVCFGNFVYELGRERLSIVVADKYNNQ